MFGIGLARISLLTGSSLGGGVGISATLDLNFRGQGYSAAMAGYTFNQLISFTRTSAATYVNSAGNIVSTPASKNLLTFTEEFDNAAWTKTDTTVTANNALAPDGNSTADTLAEGSAGTGQVGATGSVPSAGATATYSIYLKRGNTDWVRIQVLNGANGFRAWFNLGTGAVGTSAAVGTGSLTGASIASAGDGWYRCILTGAIPSATAYSAFTNTASADNSSTRVSGGNYLAWGAQLETGSTATSYVRNFGGLFPPRFDYDPVTLQPRGLLIEEQRTNLLTYSEQLDNGIWQVLSGATKTANTTVSPDGTTNADTMTATSINSGVYQTQTASNSTAYTVSDYFKAGTISEVRFGLTNQNESANAYYAFTLTGSGSFASLGITGFTAASASIISVGNGWYRCVVTATSPSTGTTAVGSMIRLSAAGTAFVWGAQLEAGSFATSYIPTVASQVTRTADQASIVAPNFAPWYNQSEGTILVEAVTFKPTTSATTGLAVDVSDGGINNRHYVGANGVFAQGRTVVGGVDQASIFQAYTANVTEKLAYAYKVNDFAFFRNGSQVGTDTSGTIPTVDRMFIGNAAGSAAFWNGWLRSIRYYPTRLTQAQGQALTA